MQKTAPKRLMESLTGKETYAAIMQCYCDAMQNLPQTFSDEALDSAKAGLAKRPHEEREFYRWCNARYAIEFLVAEIRVDTMQANWQLSNLIETICYLMKASAPSNMTEERLLARAEKMHRLLTKITFYRAGLDSFSDVLNVDLTPLLRAGTETLHEYMTLYATTREFFDEHLTAEGGFTEIVEGYLPELTLSPCDKAKRLQTDITDAIKQYRSDEFASLLLPMVEAMG